MKNNFDDYKGTQALAQDLGADYGVDPTITPMLDGNRSVLNLGIAGSLLPAVFHDESLVGDIAAYCAPPPVPGEDVMNGIPCSAGHTSCYISPYAEVFPCVQFPIACGNLREQTLKKFGAIRRSFTSAQHPRARSDHVFELQAMSARARAAPDKRTSKVTCADRLQPTARKRTTAPGFRRKICAAAD